MNLLCLFRSIRDLESKINHLKNQIIQTEKKLGSKEDLESQLQEEKAKYDRVHDDVHRLNKNIAVSDLFISKIHQTKLNK